MDMLLLLSRTEQRKKDSAQLEGKRRAMLQPGRRQYRFQPQSQQRSFTIQYSDKLWCEKVESQRQNNGTNK